MKKVYVGTSGYNYKSWKGDFYPDELAQKKWLEYYSEHFNSVEINNSFYVTVSPTTYENWYKKTPSDFSFVIKGHRYITQYRKLKNVKDSVDLFFNNAKPLSKKLKCVLWQFPANFSYKEEYFERVESFLKLLPKDLEFAFEFREEGWFNREIEKLLEEYNSTLVISQSSRFPQIEMPGNKLVYVRFHGPRGLYSSNYSDKDLESWAKKIKKFLKNGNVYAFFNNDSGNYAFKNAGKLQEILLQ